MPPVASDPAFHDFWSKCFNVKHDCRFHIGQGFFIGVPFAYYHTLQSKRIGYIAIGIFLNDDFELLDHFRLVIGAK